MSKHKKYLLFIVVAIAWVVFIFMRSLQPPNASLLESQWVLNLVELLFPVQPSMQLIRKMAHFTEYAVLGGLTALLFRGRCKTIRRTFLFSLLACTVVASCDEMIQLIISGRDGKPQDVCLDVLGSAFGILVAFAVKTLYSRLKKKR